MNKITLLTIAIASLALFVLPNTISMFVGQHAFEAGVPCHKCHVAEYCELYEAFTIDVHKRAANNTNYTTFLSMGGIEYNGTAIITNCDSNGKDGNDTWYWNEAAGNWELENSTESRLISLDFNDDGEIAGSEICHLCHNSSLFGIEGHVATVRVCDDDRCHGNRNNAHLVNATDMFAEPENVTYIITAGYNLSRTNVHQSFYLNLSNQSSTYPSGSPFNNTCGNANGSALSRGHWTCIGCHSDVGTDVILNPHPVYDHSNASAPQKRYW